MLRQSSGVPGRRPPAPAPGSSVFALGEDCSAFYSPISPLSAAVRRRPRRAALFSPSAKIALLSTLQFLLSRPQASRLLAVVVRPALMTPSANADPIDEGGPSTASMEPQFFNCGNGLDTGAGRVYEDPPMGPQFFNCGNNWSFVFKRAAKPLAMEPQFFNCGNDPPGAEDHAADRPSMEPQFFNCGNGGPSRTPNRRQSFNGAAVFQLRKSRPGRGARPTTRRFNGAAVFQLRK